MKILPLTLMLWACDLAPPALAVESQNPGSNRLLVIAPPAFRPALEDFLRHKRAARPVSFRSLEDVLMENPGADDPEKLKRFLYQQWRDPGLGYVLLVGDVDVMPVRYMVLDRITPAASDYAFYPSDLYYADLAKANGSFDDWNARKEGYHASYFGEVQGEKNKHGAINYDEVDYLPEIAVGRWPVSTSREVEVIAAKSIHHEKRLASLPRSAVFRAAFFSVSGWVDSRGQMDSWSSQFQPPWLVEKRYYSDAKRDPGTAPPDHEELRKLLNGGLDLLVHAGHGQSDAWEQCFSVADLRKIRNEGKLPVMISAGCSTAHFAPLPPYEPYVDADGKIHAGTDRGEVFASPPPAPAPYQKAPFNPTGLAEHVLKDGANGAVAYFGCNTGSQPCGLTLVEGMLGAWADSKTPLLGDCWTRAIRHYHRKEGLTGLKPDAGWYPPSIFFQGMKFMLFGDPTLRLPTNAGPQAEE